MDVSEQRQNGSRATSFFVCLFFEFCQSLPPSGFFRMCLVNLRDVKAPGLDLGSNIIKISDLIHQRARDLGKGVGCTRQTA